MNSQRLRRARRRRAARIVCRFPAIRTGRGPTAQAGFTIPELLIGALLASAAAILIATAIFQFFLSSGQGSHRLAALSDIQHASLWFSRDASEAASAAVGSGLVYGSITTSNPTVEYRYAYDPANTSLIRQHLISGEPQSTVAVARHVAAMGDVVFNFGGSVLSMTLTSTSGPIRETATVQVAMRIR